MIIYFRNKSKAACLAFVVNGSVLVFPLTVLSEPDVRTAER